VSGVERDPALLTTAPAGSKILSDAGVPASNLKTERLSDMAESIIEHVGEQIDETAQKVSRAASAVADAFEDGVKTARRMAKRGEIAAEELIDDTRKHVKSRPLESMAVILAAGIAAGTLIGLLIRRK
jgi:ElaB/YqjD/DUF883 family membrane-anchored ribosome-binding protein